METVTLDGNPITIEQLQEKLKDNSIRIVEKAPGQYITLVKLQG